jgi:hypothetical protein
MTDNDDLIVFGDFNRPTLNFIMDEDNPAIFWPCNVCDNIDEELVDTFYKNDFYQISSVKNSRNTQLDLIFSNNTDNITVSEAKADEQILKNSIHHSAIVLTCNFDMPHCNISNNKIYHYEFRNANYNNINDQLYNSDWDFLSSNNDIEYIANRFDTILSNLIEKHVPKKNYKEFEDKSNLAYIYNTLRN